MFTGIVQQRGEVIAVEPCDFGQALDIDTGGWDHHPSPGDSIAVNGCCLTVARDAGQGLRFDVIRQTLEMTTLGSLVVGAGVNLEPAVTPRTLLSGHLVQGHVDGVGVVRGVTDTKSERRLRLEPPVALLEYIVDKGSIAVDGVSLTVASLGDAWFEVALIPTTIEQTTLGAVDVGDRVNLETDCIAKTVVSWLKRMNVDVTIGR